MLRLRRLFSHAPRVRRTDEHAAEGPAFDPEPWFTGKEFNRDWLKKKKFTHWIKLLSPLRSSPLDILEIGSFEGRSAIFFLNLLPLSRMTCIDTFAGSPNHVSDPAYEPILRGLEGRFDRNTADFRDRIVKMKMQSAAALDLLASNSREFDIIYIDGSHRRDDVLADTILSWRLLKMDGIIIWDDLLVNQDAPPSERPGEAICAL